MFAMFVKGNRHRGVIFLCDMSYNVTMPKKIGEELKDEQVGFRIVKTQRDRLDLLIARDKATERVLELARSIGAALA